MKLPENLAKRYSKMTPEEMQGDASAGDLIQAGMLKSGGKPGAYKISDDSLTKAILRPGVIKWDDKTDAGVMFDVRKAGGKKIKSATHIDLDKLLHSRYVTQGVKQGRDVREFKSDAGAKAAVKAAAKVEAKATALAAKAKATKEKALEGLGYYFGATHTEELKATLNKATAAAMAPTCVKSGATLPAHICNPSLMDAMGRAAKALKAAEGGGAGAAPDWQNAQDDYMYNPPADRSNTLMLVVVASIIAVVAYLYFNR